MDEADCGSSGLTSTAQDLAAFLQMLLNGGSYGGRQILSPASVAAMTRHQVDTGIPWILPWITPTTGKRIEIDLSGGGYGYGLYIFGAGDRFRANGSLASLSAFGHPGNGGSFVWADPERELVGVYLSVSPRLHRDLPYELRPVPERRTRRDHRLEWFLIWFHRGTRRGSSASARLFPSLCVGRSNSAVFRAKFVTPPPRRNDIIPSHQLAFASASGLVTRTGLPSRKASAFSTLCG